MRSLALGLILGALVLSGAFLTPMLLRTAGERSRAEALEGADRARRELAGHNPQLGLLAARTPLDQVGQVTPDALSSAADEAYQARVEGLNKLIARAASADRKSGMPPTGVQPAQPTADAIAQGARRFSSTVTENERSLDRAIQTARTAAQDANGALGVGEVLGQTRLVESHRQLAQARRLRSRLAEDSGRLRELAHRAAHASATQAQHAAFDAAPVIDSLSADIADLTQQLDAAAAEEAQFTAAVEQVQEQLTAARGEIARLQSELLALEQTGFRPGNDAEFRSYRQRYLDLSEQLRAKQDEELLLAAGGRRGGQEMPRELEFGFVEGGEVVAGLAQLQGRRELAQVRRSRLASAIDALRIKQGSIADSSQAAQDAAQRSAATVASLQAEMRTALAGLAELAAELAKAEDAAVRAAQEAAQAFRSAAQNQQRWTSDARTAQQELDKMRKNERLQAILDDKYGEQSALGGEAQARTLLGAVLAERMDGLLTLRDAAARAAVFVSDGAVDVAALEQSLQASREAAIAALSDARQTYEKLAGKSLPTNWIHQISLAAVEDLLARIDTESADVHRAAAIESLRSAVANREQSPYLADVVLALAARWSESSPPPPPPTPSEPGPTEESDAPGDGG